MGLLRTRMEQDLLIRGRSARTRDGYLRVVAGLAKYYRRARPISSPSTRSSGIWCT